MMRPSGECSVKGKKSVETMDLYLPAVSARQLNRECDRYYR